MNSVRVCAISAFALLVLSPCSAQSLSRYDSAVGTWFCNGSVSDPRTLAGASYTGNISITADGRMTTDVTVYYMPPISYDYYAPPGMSDVVRYTTSGSWSLTDFGVHHGIEQASACSMNTGYCRGGTLPNNLRLSGLTLYVADGVGCMKTTGPGTAPPPPMYSPPPMYTPAPSWSPPPSTGTSAANPPWSGSPSTSPGTSGSTNNKPSNAGNAQSAQMKKAYELDKKCGGYYAILATMGPSKNMQKLGDAGTSLSRQKALLDGKKLGMSEKAIRDDFSDTAAKYATDYIYKKPTEQMLKSDGDICSKNIMSMK